MRAACEGGFYCGSFAEDLPHGTDAISAAGAAGSLADLFSINNCPATNITAAANAIANIAVANSWISFMVRPLPEYQSPERRSGVLSSGVSRRRHVAPAGRAIATVRHLEKAAARVASSSRYYLSGGIALMGEFLNDAAHWRRRAEQTRAKADTSFNDRGRLLKVAEEYDRLAERAEQWHPAAPPWKTRHRDRRTPL